MFKLVNMHRAFLIKETVVSMMINLLLKCCNYLFNISFPNHDHALGQRWFVF